MSDLLGNAAIGLPALAGVILGLIVYMAGKACVIWVVVLSCAGILAVGTGERLMGVRPCLGRWLIEISYVVAWLATALGTVVVCWAVLNPPLWLFGDASALTEGETKQISTAFAAAISTYVALVWTKDIGDGKGALWPGTRFRSAMKRAHGVLAVKPRPEDALYDAMFSDVVPTHAVQGWGFQARGVRASILAAHLASPPPPPPPSL